MRKMLDTLPIKQQKPEAWTSNDRTLTSTENKAKQLKEDIERFLKEGGKVQRIEKEKLDIKEYGPIYQAKTGGRHYASDVHGGSSYERR